MARAGTDAAAQLALAEPTHRRVLWKSSFKKNGGPRRISAGRDAGQVRYDYRRMAEGRRFDARAAGAAPRGVGRAGEARQRRHVSPAVRHRLDLEGLRV